MSSAWNQAVYPVISVQVLQEFLHNLRKKLQNVDNAVTAANRAGVDELWTEDLNAGQIYGSVLAVNPFTATAAE